MSGQAKRLTRGRMSGAERRLQLIDVARTLFAERGFEGTSIEEVAARAGVSKPIVYEHFGGKDGLYAVVVEREVRQLLTMMRTSLKSGRARELLEQAACALLDYIEQSSDGFRILVRDSPPGSDSGSFVSIIGDIAGRVEHILAAEFSRRGFDPQHAPLYAQMLVGMVGTTGQWWLDERRPDKEVVAAHLVNLAWNGLSGLETSPTLDTARPTPIPVPAPLSVSGTVPVAVPGTVPVAVPGTVPVAVPGAVPVALPSAAPRAAEH